MSVTPAARLVRGTGVAVSPVVPSPTLPSKFWPQHQPEPSNFSTHLAGPAPAAAMIGVLITACGVGVSAGPCPTMLPSPPLWGPQQVSPPYMIAQTSEPPRA